MATLKIFLKLILLALLVLLSLQSASAQTPVKLRATLSLGGTSNSFTAMGKHYFVQQSVGQSSVIDSYKAAGFLLRQGFIQPLKGASKASSTQTLQATISPNPFSSTITLSLTDAISENLYVTLHDLYGRILFANRFAATQELSLDFGSLAPGIYILSVTTGKMHLVAKVTKD